MQVLSLMLGILSLANLLVVPQTAARAAQDSPDVYGTVVAIDRGRGSITVAVTKNELLQIDASQLGPAPWYEGAFELDNVVRLRTQRVGNTLVATGWEEARNGRERFWGN